MKKERRTGKNRGDGKPRYKVRTKAVKREAVAAVESGELSIEMAAEKYGVCGATISNWLVNHRTKTIPPHPHEADLDIEQIAQEVIDGHLNAKQATAKYNISTSARVRFWVKRVRDKQKREQQRGQLPGTTRTRKILANESDEVKGLHRALEESQLRVLALETLIREAEKELGVDLRKKPGTKQ